MKALLLLELFLIYFICSVYCEEDGYPDFEDIDVQDELPGVEESYSKMSEPEQKHTKKESVNAIPYSPPSTDGIGFVETFDGDVFSRWIVSKEPLFSGTWEHTIRQTQALIGDKGIRIMEPEKYYGISTALPDGLLEDNKGKHLIVSYELKYEETPTCGGAYLKLFQMDKLSTPNDLASFDNKTPYIVMFGPDYCGTTNKVHLIIKHQNPHTKEWGEHHLISPPEVALERVTHVYGFHLKPDNTYEVYIDNVVVKSGSMLKDFSPPFTPEKMIIDPDDVKPDDWEENKLIPDPNAKKPDDWDEDEPVTINDPNAEKPHDWLEDVPLTIPDENAEKPSDWDDEKYGVWKPPLIPNPACENASGCGPWTPPVVANPKYRGKWMPPMIDNPNYKGPWTPRKIPNKAYFENKDPHALDDITAVGFEIWTVHSGSIFDNIVISRNMEAVKSFIDKTWKIRHDIEKSLNIETTQEHESLKENLPKDKEPQDWQDKKMMIMQTFSKLAYLGVNLAQEYPTHAVVAVFLVILFIFIIMFNLMKSKESSEKSHSATDDETEKTKVKQGHKNSEQTTKDTSNEELKSTEESATIRKRGAPVKQD